MTRTKTLLLLTALLLAVSCAPTAPPPAVAPSEADAWLVDPRLGYEASVAPATASRFENAWRSVLAGNEADARRRLTEVLTREPGFLPANVAEAALDIRAGDLERARQTLAMVRAKLPDYTAARIYEAEIAYRKGETRSAYELYRSLSGVAGAPPLVAARAAELQEKRFNELYAAAQTAPDAEAVPLLREALTLNPAAVEPRIMLAQRLLQQRQYEQARRELEPLLNTAADRVEVQEILAEIEVGRGRYEEAITRYERLARGTSDARYQRRLEEIKREWSAANMPAHYRAALESTALTRAELATLLYWEVPSVRFAQNLSAPPIAIDIENVAGRDEIIRAIAIGLYEVDPVTRRVGPFRQVTASRLSALLARLLTIRGAACARGIPADHVLPACAISDPLLTAPPDTPVTGRDAARLLEQIAHKL